MGELQGEFTLVGEQQGPPAFGIQPPDGMEAAAQLPRQQIEHDRPSLGVLAAADHPTRFVQQQQAWWIVGRQGGAVDGDAVKPGLSTVAQLGNAVIDLHAPCSEQLFGMAP